MTLKLKNTNQNNKYKNQKTNEKEILYGRNACFGCIFGRNRKIYSIHILQSKFDEYYKKIPNDLKKIVVKNNNAEMFKITHEQDKHQGIALQISNYNFTKLETLLEYAKSKQYVSFFLLDRVQDPHNIGNIIRTSFCFEIDALIISEKETCGITSAVVRTSVGYSEQMKICQVGNVNQAIEKMKKQDFWIIGLDVNKNTTLNINEVAKKYNKCVFIFGSEGQGIKEGIKKKCDILIKLPMHKDAESLNVATTTAIIAWERFIHKS